MGGTFDLIIQQIILITETTREPPPTPSQSSATTYTYTHLTLLLETFLKEFLFKLLCVCLHSQINTVVLVRRMCCIKTSPGDK